jgi:hypothetical protein
MDDDLKFLLVVYGPILALGYLVFFLDWLGRRQEQKTNKQKPA